MIVYGDQRYQTSLDLLLCQLRDLLPPAAPTLDQLRHLLILCGQIEQAGLDALPPEVPLGQQLSALTAHAADAFHAAWAGRPGAEAALGLLRATLEQLGDGDPLAVTVSVPEGYAFYALYPELYCLAALRWCADHPRSAEPGLVVGLRSIGTSLAALVRATLAAEGRDVASLTVRPTGHPFAREVQLAPAELGDARWALVVDEGPGMSGSSMAAAAAALVAAGMARERIALLPGHGGGPGSAASAGVRWWWQTLLISVASLDQLRFDGEQLPQALARATEALLGGAAHGVEDLSGGRWRSAKFPDPRTWPAAYAPWERLKYRCATDAGAVLWRYAGLACGPDGRQGCELLASQLERLAALDYTPAPLGTAHGCLALPWVAGRPLRRADLTPELAAHMGRYCAAAAGPPQPPAEQAAGLERLRELIYWNVWELLGEQAAAHIAVFIEQTASELSQRPLPRYGDGRLAPHEWIAAEDGQLLKVDAAGHDCDHTAVGAQPVLWDLAGAIVEWGMDRRYAAMLLSAFHAAGGPQVEQRQLLFCRLGYAAFRAGQSALAAQMAGSVLDRTLLYDARASYTAQIERLIEQLATLGLLHDRRAAS